VSRTVNGRRIETRGDKKKSVFQQKISLFPPGMIVISVKNNRHSGSQNICHSTPKISVIPAPEPESKIF